MSQRILTPGVFWLFVVGSGVLLGLHGLFAWIAVEAEGLERKAAAGYAIGHMLTSPVVPLALVLGLLAARPRTRTREHLALGAVITLGALLLLHGQRVGRDLDRIDDRQRESALLGVADACRDCAKERSAKICDPYCACLRERVGNADRSSFRGSRLQAKLAAILERCMAESASPGR